MGFYLIVIATLLSLLFSFVMMVTVKQDPPAAWSNWCYSKSRLAKWFEKRRKSSFYWGILRIDLFHLIGFIFSSVLFIASVIVLFIDFCTGFSITHLLNDIVILIIFLCVLIASPLYEAFLVVWWSIVDKHSNNNQHVKRIRKLTKRK